jgi:hypothetical protein
MQCMQRVALSGPRLERALTAARGCMDTASRRRSRADRLSRPARVRSAVQLDHQATRSASNSVIKAHLRTFESGWVFLFCGYACVAASHRAVAPSGAALSQASRVHPARSLAAATHGTARPSRHYCWAAAPAAACDPNSATASPGAGISLLGQDDGTIVSARGRVRSVA